MRRLLFSIALFFAIEIAILWLPRLKPGSFQNESLTAGTGN
jgi:hypothetical protein